MKSIFIFLIKKKKSIFVSLFLSLLVSEEVKMRKEKNRDREDDLAMEI